MSDFWFNCPHCQQSLEVSEDTLGKAIDCPVCNGSIQLPNPEPQPSQAALPPILQQQKKIATVGDKARDITHAEIGNRRVVDEIGGNNRYVLVTDDIVFVGSIGISSGSFFGEKVKRYPIDAITSVDVRKAMLTVELEIVMAGAVESSNTLQSFLKRSKNENITMFQKTQHEEVKRIANKILEIQQLRKVNFNKPQAPVIEPKSLIPEQIRQLAELKNAGILSHEEFEEKKKDLLHRL